VIDPLSEIKTKKLHWTGVFYKEFGIIWMPKLTLRIFHDALLKDESLILIYMGRIIYRRFLHFRRLSWDLSIIHFPMIFNGPKRMGNAHWRHHDPDSRYSPAPL
jgi:hypothetical protein